MNMHVKLLSSKAFLKSKMQQISFNGQIPPAGELTALPRSLAGLRALFLRDGREERIGEVGWGEKE